MSRSISILFVHQGYELYGSDRTMLQSVQAARLRWPDARLTVLLPREGLLAEKMREIVDDVRISDLAVLRKSNLKAFRLGSVVRLARRVRSAMKLMRAYDIVYINTVPVLDYILAAGLSGHPAIVHVHEIPTGAAAQVLSGLVRFSGASVIFNSHATAEVFQLRPGQRSEVIWNGIADIHVPKLPCDESDLHVLMIGRLNAWKGQAILLRAIALMSPEQRARVRVRIVGSYFEAQRHFYDVLIRMISENSLQSSVEILPFRADPGELYAWADVVTVPSIFPEPFGIVAIEAMAAGCAVIASNHGGLPEIILHGQTGCLALPGSAEDLAAAIASYLDDPALVQKHAEAGRTRFLEEFHESRYMERIVRFIDVAMRTDQT